jgi:hypothetical protein
LGRGGGRGPALGRRLVGGLEIAVQQPDVDGFHAGSADRLEAEVGILVRAALGWGNVESASGFQEDVGGGFLVLDILAGDDGVEEGADSEVLEHLFDGAAGAAGGDGHGEAAVVFAGDADDGVDGLDLLDEGEVFGFFFAGDGERVEGDALFEAEEAEDVA